MMFKYLKSFFYKGSPTTSRSPTVSNEILILQNEIESLKKEVKRLKSVEDLVTELANTVALISIAGMESETKFNNLAETVGYLILSSEMHTTVEKMLFKNDGEIN